MNQQQQHGSGPSGKISRESHGSLFSKASLSTTSTVETSPVELGTQAAIVQLRRAVKDSKLDPKAVYTSLVCRFEELKDLCLDLRSPKYYRTLGEAAATLISAHILFESELPPDPQLVREISEEILPTLKERPECQDLYYVALAEIAQLLDWEGELFNAKNRLIDAVNAVPEFTSGNVRSAFGYLLLTMGRIEDQLEDRGEAIRHLELAISLLQEEVSHQSYRVERQLGVSDVEISLADSYHVLGRVLLKQVYDSFDVDPSECIQLAEISQVAGKACQMFKLAYERYQAFFGHFNEIVNEVALDYSFTLIYLARFDEAQQVLSVLLVDQKTQAIEVPFQIDAQVYQAIALYMLDREEEGISLIHKADELDRTHFNTESSESVRDILRNFSESFMDYTLVEASVACDDLLAELDQ